MKFEILWNEAQHTKDGTLYRIYALRDIPQHNVKAGDRGGWIAGGFNLCQVGDAWVADDAKVFDYAQVFGDALVSGDAQLHDYVLVHGNAHVFGSAQVHDSARVFDRAHVFGKAWVTGEAWVFEDARVFGNAHVCGKLRVCDVRR